MSSSQPGSLTPSPSASLEERITETGEEGGEMGVRDEGKKRLKGKHRPLLFFTPCFNFFFPFFFTPPLLVPGCQAATMLSWPFFGSIGNSVGLSQGDRSGEEEAGRGLEDGGQRGGGLRGRSKANLMNTEIQTELYRRWPQTRS